MRGFGALLRYIALRQVVAAPLRSFLTLAGVALGVAMVVGTTASNDAVMGSFAELAERAGGKADLEIVGDESGLPQELVDELVDRPDLAAHAAGRIEQTTLLSVGGSAPQRVLVIGVDLLGDLEFLPFATRDGDTDVLADPLGFVNDPHAVLVGETLARERKLAAGSLLALRTASGMEEFRVEAVLHETTRSRAFGGQVVLLSLDAAQLAFARDGRVDRIDLALPTSPAAAFEDARAAVAKVVGDRGVVQRPSRRAAQLARMTAAFRGGLSVSALIAVLVGMFLIYNAVSVSVAQRKKEIGILRCLGVSRGRITAAFLAEAGVLGLAGSALGVLGGAGLAHAVVGQFGTNVSRFFENIAAPHPHVGPRLWLVGVAVGLIATLVAAWRPARRAARMAPVEALRRARQDPGGTRPPALWLLGATVVLAVAAAAVVRIDAPWAGLAALVLVFAAAACVTPAAVHALSPVAGRVARALLGPAGLIGVENTARELSRSALTVAALMLATALSLTMSTYTASYEASCLTWVEQAIPADVIVSAGSPLLDRNSLPFSPDWKAQIADVPGVADIDQLRTMSVPYEDLRLEVLSLDSALYLGRIAATHSDYRRVVDGPRDLAADALAGAEPPTALVSENFARKKHLHAGDSVTITSPTGPHPFRIAAVVVDYSTDQGLLIIDRRWAREYWNDDRVEAMYLYLTPDADPQAVADAVRTRLAATPEAAAGLFVTSNAAFKAEIRQVIHQTFGVSKAAEFIALLVSVLGVIGTMLARVIDRVREIGVLRAIGAHRRQVFAAIATEAGWLGLCAALVGAVAAIPASLIFVDVIGVQASGWSVDFIFPWAAFVRVVGSIVLLAVLAGLLPAWRASRLIIRDALSYE